MRCGTVQCALRTGRWAGVMVRLAQWSEIRPSQVLFSIVKPMAQLNLELKIHIRQDYGSMVHIRSILSGLDSVHIGRRT